MAGLVLDELGRIPHRGEEFDAFGARFHISEVTDRAVLAVRVRLLEEHDLIMLKPQEPTYLHTNGITSCLDWAAVSPLLPLDAADGVAY